MTPLADVSDGAASHALADLRDAGLVSRRQEGQWRYYDATERAEALVEALDGTTGRRSDAGERTMSAAADHLVRVAFVCVQNAGRSQMAHAFAERERQRRDAGDRVTVLTGGTQPADAVHDVVVEAMAERGIDVSDRTPREVPPDELRGADVVVTMGCSAEDVCPATGTGDDRDWGLDDPHGRPIEEVREIRDEVEQRVVALFEELVGDADGAGADDR